MYFKKYGQLRKPLQYQNCQKSLGSNDDISCGISDKNDFSENANMLANLNSKKLKSLANQFSVSISSLPTTHVPRYKHHNNRGFNRVRHGKRKFSQLPVRKVGFLNC